MGPTSASSGDTLSRLMLLEPADDLLGIRHNDAALQEMTCSLEGHRRKQGQKKRKMEGWRVYVATRRPRP